MKLRELGTLIVVIAVLVGYFVAHEASHAVSEKITNQPVTSLPAGK